MSMALTSSGLQSVMQVTAGHPVNSAAIAVQNFNWNIYAHEQSKIKRKSFQ